MPPVANSACNIVLVIIKVVIFDPEAPELGPGEVGPAPGLVELAPGVVELAAGVVELAPGVLAFDPEAVDWRVYET